MKLSYAKKLNKKTVDDYNRMSTYFSNTRAIVPQDIHDLLKNIEKGDRVLDFGCGNGRLYSALPKGVAYTGLDNCPALIEIAGKKYGPGLFAHSDQTKLSFEEDTFDHVFSLAVFHHLPSLELREKYARELVRVLRSGGRATITVWNLNDKADARKLKLKFNFLKLIGLNQMDFNDILYPFRNGKGEKLADRYIHLFTQAELTALFTLSNVKVIDQGINERGKSLKSHNYFVVVEKL